MDLITLLHTTARSFPEHDAIRYQQRCTPYPAFVQQTRQAARVLKDLGVHQFSIYLQHDDKDHTLAAYGEKVLPAVAEHVRAKS